jgi:hypothetical protein
VVREEAPLGALFPIGKEKVMGNNGKTTGKQRKTIFGKVGYITSARAGEGSFVSFALILYDKSKEGKIRFLVAADQRNTAFAERDASYGDNFQKICTVPGENLHVVSVGQNVFGGESIPEIVDGFDGGGDKGSASERFLGYFSGKLKKNTKSGYRSESCVVGFDSDGKDVIARCVARPDSCEISWIAARKDRGERRTFLIPVGEEWARNLTGAMDPEIFARDDPADGILRYTELVRDITHFAGGKTIGGEVKLYEINRHGYREIHARNG